MDNQKNLKKRDLILVAAVLLIAGLLLLWNRFYYSSPAAYLIISVDGETVETLDLTEDQEITINSGENGHNHIIIKDGEAWVEEATCPNQDCVRQGKISMDGQQLVCLPNKMIARIAGAE